MEAEDEEAGGMMPPRTRACSIKLDTRKLSQALHFLNIKYDNAMCCTCLLLCHPLLCVRRLAGWRSHSFL